MNVLIIYSTHITPRLQYIADSIFHAEMELTDDKEKFSLSSAAKINYSPAKVSGNELWIQPHSLLFENNIHPQNTACFDWRRLKVFFKTEGDIAFDIFAASFYLLSRYEEYLPHEKDMYGRYAHTNSLAYKENFLHLPLVNLWMIEFIKLFQQKFPQLLIPDSQFRFLPTCDIDIAYSYLHQSFLKNTGGILLSMVNACLPDRQGQWSMVKERINVLLRKQKDPFDTYEWLDALHEKYNLKPFYFFLLAEKRKAYDKNISPHSKSMQKLIKHHAEKYSIGIHPSWQSGDDENILRKEILLLRNISGKAITGSRQHYIRMKLPETYRLLAGNRITDDYSPGYGSINGFRASYCLPFSWYDLEKEEQTSLTLHPFCYMEANSFFEQGYTSAQAADELQQYFDIVKKVNGTLITIFHNHFLTEQPQWIEWREMYEEFLIRNFVQ